MQYWNTTTHKYLLSVILIFSSLSVFGQDNSPYSRYGIGTLKAIENVANRGMGGISLTDNNALIANPTNPATYTGLKLTSFQVGFESASVHVFCLSVFKLSIPSLSRGLL
jgi:hypothetical protein